jgi:hypothetical protein
LQNHTEEADLTPSQVPYLDWDPNIGRGKSVFVESYGCQMNLSDTEIVYAIMEQSGYQKAQVAEEVRLFQTPDAIFRWFKLVFRQMWCF